MSKKTVKNTNGIKFLKTSDQLFERIRVIEKNERMRNKVQIWIATCLRKPIPKDVLRLIAEFSFYDNVALRLPELE